MSRRNLFPPATDNGAPYALGMAANGDEVTIERGELAKTGRGLPKDFIVSCVFSSVAPEIEGSKLMYITDQNRYIPLEPSIIPDMTGNAFSVDIIGNDIHFSYRLDLVGGVRQFGRGAIRGCYIVDNELFLESTEYNLIPSDVLPSTFTPENITLHGEGYKDGFLYDVTRSQTGPTYIIKTNANNLQDYQVKQLFDGGYIHNIDIYENYIYYMYVNFSDVTDAYIGRISLDLDEPEEVFDINTDLAKVAYAGFPFLIYRGNICIPTVNTTDLTSLRNKLRIMMYSMTGELLAQSDELEIATTGTTLRVFPHWFTAFNGKFLLHTAVSVSSVKKLIRIDINTLTLDGANSVVDAPSTSITDDNTVTSPGAVYLNSESSTSAMQYLYVLPDYRDFTTITLQSTIGYRSTGTPPTYVPKDAMVSVEPSTQNLQEVTDNGNTTTNEINVPAINFPQGDFIDSQVGSLNISHPAQVAIQNETSGTNITVGTDEVSMQLNGANGVVLKGTNLTANRDLEYPNVSGTFAVSASVNGGTPVVADANGNIDLTVAGGSTPTLKQTIEENGIATALTVPFAVETSDTAVIYGEAGVQIGDGGLGTGTVLTTGLDAALYQNDVTDNITADNHIPNKKYVDDAVSAGGGATNLTYTPSPSDGKVNSDTGTDATIPLADATNAGLLAPADKTKLNNTSGTNTGDNIQATETVSGIAEIATQAEVNTGTDDLRIVTPLKNKVMGDATYVALTGNQTIAGNKTLSGTTTFGAQPTITGGLTTNYLRGDMSAASYTTTFRSTAWKSTAYVENSAAPSNVDGASITGDKLLYMYNMIIAGMAYVGKTAGYTIANTDMVVDLTANTATFVLPTAVGIAGKRFTVKNSGAGTLTVNTTSSQTIDGATSKVFNTQYGGMTVVSDGANYKIISAF